MENAKILLVDDEVIFTKNMSKLLTTRGYQILIANSGEEAIQVLERDKCDVMVLDLKMPGMNGIATLLEMQKRNLSAQTLVLTGHGDIDTAMKAMKLGAHDYLTKPCEIDELVEKIEEIWKKKNGNGKKSKAK